MIHKINNNHLYLAVDTEGAQLRSLCDVHGTEYLWQPDEKIWTGQAPVLFPVVGRFFEGKYIYDGKTYEMENHGFAQTSRFKVVKKLSDSITLRITENEETLRQYPFRFTFDVSFELSDNSFTQRFIITNNSDCEMPYALGGHPGFRVPIEDDEKFEDYYLKFEYVENCKVPVLRRDMLAESDEWMPLLDNTNILPLRRELFTRGVLVLENHKSRSVELISSLSGKGIRMDFEGFDNLGLWSWNNGNYLCIEPWSSPGTHSDPSGLIEKRKGMKILSAGDTAEYAFKATVI